MDYGLMLLSKIIETHDKIVLLSLKPDIFYKSLQALELYLYLINYKSTDGHFPTVGKVKKDKGFDCLKTDKSVEYYLSLAILHSKGIDTGESTVEPINLVESIEYRHKRYLDKKTVDNGIDGITTPWQALNDATLGLHAGDLVIVVGKYKVGKCLAENSEIYLPETGKWKTINEVIKERTDSVLSFNIKENKFNTSLPVSFWDNGKKECFEVGTQYGKSIVGTANHPLLTSNGWKNIENLCIGDRIAAVKYVPEPLKALSVDKEKVDILSLMLAEGGMTTSSITFTNTDAEIINIFKNACKYFNCTTKERGKYGFGISGNGSNDGKFDRNSITKLLREYNIFGHKSITKFVPDEVFTWNNNALARFIGVFWSCDGYINKKNGDVDVCLGSKKLILDIQKLLLRFGITGYVSYKKSKCGNKFFDAWRFRLDGHSKRLFLECIPLFGKKRLVADGVKKLCIEERGVENRINSSPKIKNQLENIVLGSMKSWDNFFKYCGWKKTLKYYHSKKRKTSVRDFISPSNTISVKRLRSFCEYFNDNTFEWVCNEGIYWDKITSITPVGIKNTYDLTINETSNFVANGLIVHNSFWVLSLSEHVWRSGKKVMFISMEQLVEAIGERFDAIANKLPYWNLRRGLLNKDHEKQYLETYKKELKDKQPFLFFDKSSIHTIGDVERAIIKHKPDLVIVDGYYLLAENRGDWKDDANLVGAFKDLALRYKLPIVGVTHFNRSMKSGGLNGDLENIAMTDAVGKLSDLVIGLFQNEDKKLAREMSLKLLKIKEGEPIQMTQNWNFDTMDFSQKALITQTVAQDVIKL